MLIIEELTYETWRIVKGNSVSFVMAHVHDDQSDSDRSVKGSLLETLSFFKAFETPLMTL